MWNQKLVDQVRDWTAQLFVWDQAEKQRIVRAADARGYGLPEDIYARPFPGSMGSSLSMIVKEPSKPVMQPLRHGNGTLAKAALLTALTLGASGAGFGLSSLLNRPATPGVSTSTTSGFLIDLIPPDKGK